jgi:outer membrane protein TolC
VNLPGITLRLLLILFFLPVSAFAITPAQLKKLVERYSLDVRISKERVKGALFQRKAVFREYFPKLNLNVGFQEFYPDFKENWNQQYSYGLSVTSEVLNLKRNVELSIDKEEIERLRESYRETLLTVYYSALRKLYLMKFNYEKIKIRKSILDSAKEILKVAEEKYRKGLVMITDVLKAKSEVDKAESSLIQAKSDYRKAFNDLNSILDFSLKTDEKPEVSFTKEPLTDSAEELLKRALKLRPEIREVQREVKEKEKEVELQKRTLSPVVSISFSAKRSGTELPGDKSYSAGVNLSYPLFDSGQTTYRALAKKSELVQAKLKLKKEKNQVRLEVLNALSDVKAAYGKLKSAESSLNYSKKAYERALNEYKLGVSDIVLLLQTFRNYKNAQESYLRTLYNYNLSLVSLKKATGELLRR